MEETMGMIKLFAGTFAPRGWMICQGQLLEISQNTALFSIIGNYYGGDGRVTFALPDFRGAVPVGLGQAPGADVVINHVGENRILPVDGTPEKDDKTYHIREVGMHYVICTEGIYPARQ